jgi:hypothetical protein
MELTNKLMLVSVLVTNWFPVVINEPHIYAKNNLGIIAKDKEVGIISSNRYARFVLDGQTNDLVLSTEVINWESLLVKEGKPPAVFWNTNSVGGGHGGIMPKYYYWGTTNSVIFN